MINSTRKCRECGYFNLMNYKFCIKCGAPLPSVLSSNFLSKLISVLLRKDARKPITARTRIVIIISSLIIPSLYLLFFFSTFNPTTIINPEAMDWIPLESTNTSFEKFPWANIEEAKYAGKANDLFFLVKWNSSSRMPASVVPTRDLSAPHYLIYRKAYISWTIHDDTRLKYSKIQLLVGDNDFVLFEFVEGEGCVDFSYITNNQPFVNETTAVFSIRYKPKPIPIENLYNLSITPASEFIAHNHYTQHEFQSLLEIPESPSKSITIDGNLTDWSQSNVLSLTFKADTTNQTQAFMFPTFNQLFLTRSEIGVHFGVYLSQNNFTDFIVEQGNQRVSIFWTVLISAINGSFASDYAFSVSLFFTPMNGYSIQKVTIELVSDYASPTDTKEWQLPYNQSGTNSGFEGLFPVSIISHLYDTNDRINFSTWLVIEWILPIDGIE